VRQSGLAGDILPEVYSPDLDDTGEALSFVIRVTGEPASLISAVRGAVAEVDPNQPLYNVMTMEQRLANLTTSRRLNTALLGCFAAVALLLAVVGIYGVMSYAVTQRRREIGVRMALGAQKSDVLGLIIRGGLRLTLTGVVIGLIGALALTRYLSSQLYSVKATDPVTFAVVSVLMVATAILACWLPARRAAKVDPMEALRNE
jgi:ABC-type antimicrobial peptide transport system permease subunit